MNPIHQLKKLLKRPEDKAARTTISMPPKLLALAEAMQAQRGYGTFSDFMQSLIRAAARDQTTPTHPDDAR